MSGISEDKIYIIAGSGCQRIYCALKMAAKVSKYWTTEDLEITEAGLSRQGAHVAGSVFSVGRE